MPKIVNPNWHPEAPSQLTVAQRRNLHLLLSAGPSVPRHNGRKRVSLDSLVRHELATVTIDPDGDNLYTASKKALEWRAKGYI